MLRDIRKEKCMTQNKLAEVSGVNLRMIQHYEQGEKDINNAKLFTLASLAEALECKISDILTDDELIHKCKKVTL